MYTPNGLLEQVYLCLEENIPLSTIHIPHSDVFYVREALESRFSCDLTLEQTEEYMREAGWSDGPDPKIDVPLDEDIELEYYGHGDT